MFISGSVRGELPDIEIKQQASGVRGLRCGGSMGLADRRVCRVQTDWCLAAGNEPGYRGDV
jgi:hypothetical protein